MELKVANQAWIAAALLHRAHPERPDFSVDEIRQKAQEEFGPLRPGVYQHIGHHGLAKKVPAPARLRFFTETARGRRRLFRPGDPQHEARRLGKTHPRREELPQRYHALIDWYEGPYAHERHSGSGSAPAGSAPAKFLCFVGLIPAFDLEIMRKSADEDCERIDEASQ
jgi:hypothetical protein